MKESVPFGRSISLTTGIIYANPGVWTQAAAEPHIHRLLPPKDPRASLGGSSPEKPWCTPSAIDILFHTLLGLSISIVDEQPDYLTKWTFLVGITGVVVYMTAGTTTHTTSWSAHTTLVKSHADPAEIIDEYLSFCLFYSSLFIPLLFASSSFYPLPPLPCRISPSPVPHRTSIPSLPPSPPSPSRT